MARLAWCTDIHLDFLSSRPNKIIDFINSIKNSGVDGVAITGDISTADQLAHHLGMLDQGLQLPIYFVLGNHDYFNGSIEGVRKAMHGLTNHSPYLKYMPTLPYVSVGSAAIVGHDGWYDGLNGDWKQSNFLMNDWAMILDYVNNGGGHSNLITRNHDLKKIVDKSQELALEGVQHIHDGIKAAVKYHKSIIVLTHVPPWQESHIFQGRVGDASAQPWFTSKMMGTMLEDASRSFPDVKFTVLAGHTHGKFDGQITNNIKCHVGGAEYGEPVVQSIIEIV